MDALLLQSLTIEQLFEKLKDVVNTSVETQLEIFLKKQEKEIKYISRKQAAEILGCSLNTLDDWALKKIIKAYPFRGSVKYLKHEIEEAGPNIIRRAKKGDRHD